MKLPSNKECSKALDQTVAEHPPHAANTAAVQCLTIQNESRHTQSTKEIIKWGIHSGRRKKVLN